MVEAMPAREERRVRVFALGGIVDGSLLLGTQQRTLDDLNMASKRFVVLHSPSSRTDAWSLGSGPLAINKKAILFIQELTSPPPQSGRRFGKFSRAPLRLKIKSCEIEGFVHVPPGGEPMKRLDQDNHIFLSLTTVLITGPDNHATLPFLAVNRDFITTAQVVEPDEELDALPSTNVDLQA